MHKVVTALIAACTAALFPASSARADRESVCEDLDGLWSDRSEFIQITGRAACELTPETPGGTLLQLQFEYPADVANDSSGAKQLATWIKTRIGFYQKQFGAEGDGREVAVGVTYDESQPSASSRTVVFTETAFTKGSPQPVTQKLTQSFTLAAPIITAPPVEAAPDGSTPAPETPAPAAPAPATTTPVAPPASAPGSNPQAPAFTYTPGAVAPTSQAPTTAPSAPVTTLPPRKPSTSVRPLR